MAYNFSAEKRSVLDLQILHKRLSEFVLIEFFPVEVSNESLTLGISIPFKAMEDPRFENELERTMSYLVTEQGFEVIDLFTGKSVASSEISRLAQKISS